VVFWDTTYNLSGGSTVSGWTFTPIIHTFNASDNSYGVIGALRVDGPGSTKAVYGRGHSLSGHTGTAVGLVGATTKDPGSLAANLWALQLENQGAADEYIHMAPTIPGDVVQRGMLIDANANVASCAFQYNRYVGGGSLGDFLKMLGGGGGELYRVNKDGQTFGRTISPVQTDAANITGAVTLDFNTQQVYNASMLGNVTLTLSNVPTGSMMRILLQATTGLTLAFGVTNTIFWPNGVAPVIDAGPAKKCLITAWCFSAGVFILNAATY
jgi:hypothetical protein